MTMDAEAHLRQLLDELKACGWTAEESARRLTVVNPESSALRETVTCDGVSFLWSWGPVIGPVDDVPAAAGRIMHVLRTVRAC